jgi:Domain of unknown function (DUF4281)
MNPDLIFRICNIAALASWVLLIAAPRWKLLPQIIRWGVLTLMAVLYSVLIAVYFFRVEGGGFSSLAAVQALFTSREVALAGWVHYLAFDLFVGLWIAEKSDDLGIARIVQAPVFVTTFMFGPLGFLMFQAVLAFSSAYGAVNKPNTARW